MRATVCQIPGRGPSAHERLLDNELSGVGVGAFLQAGLLAQGLDVGEHVERAAHHHAIDGRVERGHAEVGEELAVLDAGGDAFLVGPGLARDRGGPRLLGQLLQCPMLDDRNETPSAHQYDGVGVWDRTSNLTAWRAVLGARCGGPGVSPYEASARATDLRGLPPTFIDVGGAETFRDECILFASRILAAGGECELHVWGGAFHGFHDIAPQTAVAQACIIARENWLDRLLQRK